VSVTCFSSYLLARIGRQRRYVGEHADAEAVDAVGVVHGLEREQVAEGRAVLLVVGQLHLRRRARAQPVHNGLDGRHFRHVTL